MPPKWAPLEERILRKVQKDERGCWRWTGYISPAGYGQIGQGNGKGIFLVHRASWLVFRGPIPEGMELDHLCRVRHCINPDHLEPVTRQENMLRVRGEYCPKGLHRMEGDNRYVTPSTGKGRCAACARESRRLRMGWE